MGRNDIRKRDRKLGPIQRAVNDYLASTGNLNRGTAVLCIELWPQVVGTWYARKTQVIGIRDGQLQVLCDTAACAQQLQMDADEILRRLNDRVDGDVIKKLRASTAGRWKSSPALRPKPEESPTITAEDLQDVELTDQEIAECEQAAAGIENDDIRQRFLETLKTEMKRRRVKLQRGQRECPICGGLFPGIEEYCPVCRANIGDGSMRANTR
jgi:rubrerythrin